MTEHKEYLQKVNHALRIQTSELERLADTFVLRAKAVRLEQYKQLLMMSAREIQQHAQRLEMNAFTIMAIIGELDNEPTDQA